MRTLALLIVVGVVSGCQSIQSPLDLVDIPSGIPWKAKPKAKGTAPVRMAATWTDAVLNQTGKPSERGFGGKVFFYNRKDTKPVEVEGQFVVYAFEEDGRDPTDHRPTRRYVFPPEQMERHLSVDDIGPSYSFWLPWDESGGMRKNVSLIARFEPLQGGEMLVSDQTSHYLPGQYEPEIMIAKEEPTRSEVQQASYTAASNEAPQGRADRLETTAISLPSSIQQRANSGVRSELIPRRSTPHATR